MAINCENHPVKQAVAKCKQCGKNLCRDCVIQKENGSFCSIECYQKAKQFKQKVVDYGPSRKKHTLRNILVIIFIIIAGIWALKNYLGVDLIKMVNDIIR